MILITSGCTQQSNENDKGETNQNGQNQQEQYDIYNGQVIVNDYYGEGALKWGKPAKAFNESQLAAMEVALANGVKIDDKQNDWILRSDNLPEGEVDNLNPYPLNWTDLKSVSFGADNEYIYFKFEFWGAFPRNAFTYEGDLIRGGGGYIGELTFGPGEHDWAQLQNSISYLDESNTSQIATMPHLFHEVYISPTGEVDAQFDDIYEITTREGLIGGGAETNYLITACPLKLLGLEIGDTTTFKLGCEFHSTKYHHCDKDYILDFDNPQALQGGKIRYVLGSNTYENLDDASQGFFIITPYVNESDIDSVPEAYGLADSNPYWGFRHPGVDFKTSKDLIQVRAVSNGTVTNINIAKENGQMGWHAGFCIQYNDMYSVCYNLETFSQSDEIEQKVRDNFFIAEGQVVKQGDIIANLVYGGDGCHIDFGVCIPGNRICPEPFFTEEAKASVMRLIQKDHPDWPMCCD